MSLFTDLKEVLTPYANRIKGLSTDVNTINTTLNNLEPGLSDDAKQALLECIKHVVWDTENYETLYGDLEAALESSSTPVPVYQLSKPLICTGRTYVSTGIKLYDIPRDYTVLIDLTIPSDYSSREIESIVDCMDGETSPAHGLFVGKWKNNASNFQYTILQTPNDEVIQNQAYNSGNHRLKLAVRSKVSRGVGDVRGTLNGQTAVFATVATRAFSVVDKYVGLGGQIKMDGTMYNDRYFKGTINDCKIYYEYLSNYEVGRFLS